MIEFFKATTRFIIFCETWADCEWDVEKKYEKDEYEKDEYEKNEYEKNAADVDTVDADVDDVDADDVDDVDHADDANDVDDVDDASDVDDVDDVDVDVDSTIIEDEKKKRRTREWARDLINRKKDWEVRILLIHWSEDAC